MDERGEGKETTHGMFDNTGLELARGLVTLRAHVRLGALPRFPPRSGQIAPPEYNEATTRDQSLTLRTRSGF